MRYFLLLLLWSLPVYSIAQKTYLPPEQGQPGRPVDKLGWFLENPEQNLPAVQSARQLPSTPLRLKAQAFTSPETYIVRDPDSGLPIFIRGNFSPAPLVQSRSSQVENIAFSFLEDKKSLLRLDEPEGSFQVIRQHTDDLGMTHLKLQQRYRGLPVYGAEVVLHLQDETVQVFNGRYVAPPRLQDLSPRLHAEEAVHIALQDLATFTQVREISPYLATRGMQRVSHQELVVFCTDATGRDARLAYHLQINASLQDHWSYLIDAHRGEILRKHNLVCKMNHGLHDHPQNSAAEQNVKKDPLPSQAASTTLDGPASAVATDLLGINRDIDTYLYQGLYYLFDASREMWRPTANFPNDYFGAIETADADNTNTSNFQAKDISSPNNQWNNPTAVSAHYNSGVAYEYFRNTFGRNSIDGTGGNILSFINVADEDGGGFDNAFWNGQYMFYGNGRDFFYSLAAALDVAGHEMSHGVIQNTANLEYQGESGALNESFADVFAVLIDRDDWTLAEDIVRPGVFPGGAMRNMQNPKNGGSRLSDPGYQPASVSEMYLGTEDNGGVHINSGIPNRAFYLVASQIGRDKAEQIYYHALDNYLTRSSQFIDARLALIQSAQQRYGQAEANTVAAAFDAVGITAGTPTPPPAEAQTNEGQQFILAVGEGSGETGQGIYFTDPQGNLIDGANPLVNDEILFKPSISDDGSRILYINGNNQLRLVLIDWNAGSFQVIELDNNRIWRRAAISKDGLKAATTTNELEPEITVYDLTTGTGLVFPLYNPTYTQGVTAGDVEYADGLEWDLSSQYVIYDAFSRVSGLFSEDTYVDIGIMQAWNNQSNDYWDGKIEKLYNSLPEGVLIGNPAISKNSPNILTFDYIDTQENLLAVLGVDLETGNTGVIAETSSLGFPNYSVDDRQVIYEDEDFSGGKVIKVVDLEDDKISALGQGQDFLSGAIWPNWFATGSRVIATSVQQNLNPDGIALEAFPNPGSQNLFVRTDLKSRGELQFQIFDMLGQLQYQLEVEAGPGVHQSILPIDQLTPGTYLLKMRYGQNLVSQKIVKW